MLEHDDQNNGLHAIRIKNKLNSFKGRNSLGNSKVCNAKIA